MSKLSARHILITVAATALLASGCGQSTSGGDNARGASPGAGAKLYCEAVSRIEHFPSFEQVSRDEVAQAASEYEMLGLAASDAAPDEIAGAAHTVADAMATDVESLGRVGFDPTLIETKDVAVADDDLMTAERMISEWLRLNCPDDLDDPASVVQHLFEVSHVPLDDRRTFLRESVALFTDDAVLIRHPNASVATVVGADEIGAVLEIGRDEGVESDGVDVVSARGNYVIWNEVWLQPDGSLCNWSKNEAVVIDGQIATYRVGDISCTP